ncbi:MAG: S-adenosylmethionine:tRNA ribosyltransferase-isomerase [Candidatus Thermoplasmatota archaeon]|nr:S-adenosylmethionine:tRNA ribosyltransferase-isomerase [Candidatus Thermoplasmatota archaeon]
MNELRYEEYPSSITGRIPRLISHDAKSGTISISPLSEIALYLDSGDLMIFNDSLTVPNVLILGIERVSLSFYGFGDNGCLAVCDFVPRTSDLRKIGLEPVLTNSEVCRFRYLDRTRFLRTLIENGKLSTYDDVPFPIENYRGNFSYVPGSAEFPSASYHFSEEIVKSLRNRGVLLKTLTLHTSASWHQGREYPPFDEYYRIPEDTAAAITGAKDMGQRIIAVGTSSARAVESADFSNATNLEGTTSLILGTSRNTRILTGLVTGLHQKGSSHYELLHAFLPKREVDRISNYARSNDLAAGMFGDLCLLI